MANHLHLYDYEEIYPYDFTEPIYYDVRYDLPEDIIRNKRDSRYFPGHVPAGVKGITKVIICKFVCQTLNKLFICFIESFELHPQYCQSTRV